MTAANDARTDTVRNTNDIKISTRTLEFAVYVAAVLATIITSVVADDASENGVDVFNAHDAMQRTTSLRPHAQPSSSESAKPPNPAVKNRHFEPTVTGGVEQALRGFPNRVMVRLRGHLWVRPMHRRGAPP